MYLERLWETPKTSLRIVSASGSGEQFPVAPSINTPGAEAQTQADCFSDV
jgi:hypothetical protein